MQKTKNPQTTKKEKFLPHPEWLMGKIIEAEMDRDPFVIALMKNYAAFRDSSIAAQIWQRIEPKLTEIALRKDSFSPNPHNNEVYGDLEIGKVKHTRAPFGLNLDELGQHTLITGRAGAGKTTLIYIILLRLLELGIPFWTFDFKQDYRHLAKTGKVLVFDWESFRFNPLRPPPGVRPQLWIQAFTNVFCQSYYLLAGSKAILIDELEKLYNDYGVFEGSEVYPTVHDLYDSLLTRKFERKYGRERESWESVKTRTQACLHCFGKMLSCDKGFPIEDLLNNNVVFELEGLLSDNQGFLLSIILRYVFQYRLSNNQRSSLKHIFLFDEAKTVYNKQKEHDQKIGIPEIAEFTTKIREFGEGLVVADQMPTQLADSIKSNVYTVICMSQSGGLNVLEMTKALGLTKEQPETCRTLQSDTASQVFEAIVKLNGKWVTPFVIHVKPYKVNKDVTNFKLQTFMKPMFEELNRRLTPRTEYKAVLEAKTRKAQEQRKEYAEQKQTFEGATLIKILTNIRDHPFIDQKERISMLNLGSSSSTNDKYFKELLARGLATKHLIGLGKGQSTKVFYEITDKGKDFARMTKVEIPGKGDFKHKFWQHTIQNFFQCTGYNPEIEKRYGFKNVDIGLEMDGLKTAIEVELSGPFAHVIENIQKDLEAGCDQIIIAVESKRKLNSYKKELEKIYTKDVLGKIEFRLLSDFLENN